MMVGTLIYHRMWEEGEEKTWQLEFSSDEKEKMSSRKSGEKTWGLKKTNLTFDVYSKAEKRNR